VAEKLRAAVEAMKVQLPGVQLQKTISIGVATFQVDSSSFWQIVKYADIAMYQAKENGRNRVLHFSPEMWTGQTQY
ncbi:MAG: diguanylate cyclase, partial [Gammaproteobacteria bacterium]|nr:diguanylate cyclase [Gammaproteobacteria bacterium]